MEKRPTEEEIILNHLERSALPVVDSDPILARKEQEMLILSEPEVLKKSIQTIFDKYSAPVDVFGETRLYTPPIAIDRVNVIDKDGLNRDTQFFVSNLADERIHAVIQKTHNGVSEQMTPLFVFSQSQTSNESKVFFKQDRIDDEEEFLAVRHFIDKLRDAYQEYVRLTSDSINLAKYLAKDGQNFRVPDYYYFDWNSPFRDKAVETITQDKRISEAFDKAIQYMYEIEPGLKPKPGEASPIGLMQAGVICGNEKIALPVDNLLAQFKEMAIFDSDEHTLAAFRKGEIWKQCCN